MKVNAKQVTVTCDADTLDWLYNQSVMLNLDYGDEVLFFVRDERDVEIELESDSESEVSESEVESE